MDAKRDQNRVTTLLGVSSVDGVTPVTLYVDPTTHRLLVDAASSSIGPGTINEIAYFDTTTTIASLAVATYPSLTELSYVKGVTSSIQTQLNAKGAGTVTGTGTVNELSYWTSSTAQGTLAVATYPSLTEVSYVKGVTSAIQTQFTAKANLASPTFTGTVVLPSGQALIAPALGTPASGTLTNATGLPIAGLVASTTQALGVGSIELGHASDTTIARSSAGNATIEGDAIALEGYTTTATAAGTTTLTVASKKQQYFTGTTTQTVTLPVTSTLVLGQTFTVKNLSTGIVTVNSSGANAVLAIPSVTTAIFTCILVTGTTAASWSVSSYLNTPSAGGGSSTPTMKVTFDFGTTGRYTTAGNDGGFSINGVSLAAGGGAGSTTTVTAPLTQNANMGVYAGSPIFTCAIFCNALVAASGVASSFFGIGTPTVAGAGHTYTVRHIGFKLLKTGGVVSLYATQADGTTETASSALTTVVDNDVLDLIVKCNSTTSVDYYWRKNGGALSSATNLTTNIPSGTSTSLQFSTSNNNTAFNFTVSCPNASYER